MQRPMVISLRIVIVALLLGSVLTQILMPFLAEDIGGTYRETAALVAPYSAVAIVAIACLQVAVLATWWLLTRVSTGSIFSDRSLSGADVIIVCLRLATLLPAGVMLHLLVTVGGGPGVMLALAAYLVVGAAVTLLMVVMRGLLRAAISDHTELEAVI